MAGELTQGEKETLAAINVGASALSFAGSAFIVLCYVLFRELRKFSFKLIFYLALSDMFCSLFNILGDPGKGFFCYTQGYTTHFVCVASFLWTTTIAFTLHRTVVRHKTDVEELGAIFHLYVWGTSLVMTIIPSIGDGYGKAGAWCLVQTTPRATKVLQFITFYAPLWGAILFNGFTYFQVNRMLNNATRVCKDLQMHEGLLVFFLLNHSHALIQPLYMPLKKHKNEMVSKPSILQIKTYFENA